MSFPNSRTLSVRTTTVLTRSVHFGAFTFSLSRSLKQSILFFGRFSFVYSFVCLQIWNLHLNGQRLCAEQLIDLHKTVPR